MGDAQKRDALPIVAPTVIFALPVIRAAGHSLKNLLSTNILTRAVETWVALEVIHSLPTSRNSFACRYITSPEQAIEIGNSMLTRI
jgi:hypothetical protein